MPSKEIVVVEPGYLRSKNNQAFLIYEDCDEKHIHLTMIKVYNEYLYQGYGKSILEYFLYQICDKENKDVSLEVVQFSNAFNSDCLQSWYGKYGFQVANGEVDYYEKKYNLALLSATTKSIPFMLRKS